MTSFILSSSVGYIEGIFASWFMVHSGKVTITSLEYKCIKKDMIKVLIS